jgi:hypothetical protein
MGNEKNELSNQRCAPGTKYEAGHCARLIILVELAKAYNSEHPDDIIELSELHEIANPNKYKQMLVNSLGKKIKERYGCDNHKCWTKQKFVARMEQNAREELEKYTHRPDSPQGRFTWLNTFNIEDSMAQYEKKYDGFKFLGAVPMDFSILDGLQVNQINYLDKAKSGESKLGIIFNLDEHYKSGSHWVALYTDLEKGQVYYFDSYGIRPEKRVRQLMRQFINTIIQLGKRTEDIEVKYNKIRHQRENSECGVYSMNFIIRMARGDNFNELCNKIIPDRKINKCRMVYFDNWTKNIKAMEY